MYKITIILIVALLPLTITAQSLDKMSFMSQEIGHNLSQIIRGEEAIERPVFIFLYEPDTSESDYIRASYFQQEELRAVMEEKRYQQFFVEANSLVGLELSQKCNISSYPTFITMKPEKRNKWEVLQVRTVWELIDQLLN